MLQKGNRFCPFCFADQFAEREAGDASQPVEVARAVAAAVRKPGRLVIDFADTAQPGAEEVIQIPGPAGSSLEEADSEIGFVRPGIFNPMEDPPGEGHAPGGARRVTPRRLVIGIAGALVLVALAAGLRRAYVDVRSEAGRPQALEPQAEHVQAAQKPPAEAPPQAPPESPPEVPPDVAPVPVVRPVAPVAADPAPSGGKAAVEDNGCSEALAAMALCPGK